MPGESGARAGRRPRRAAGQPRPRWRGRRPARAHRGRLRGHPEGGSACHGTHARGEAVSTSSDHILRMGSQHLAELKRKAAEFERQLWDAHESLEYEMEQASFAPQPGADGHADALRWPGEDLAAAGGDSPGPAKPGAAHDPRSAGPGPAPSPEERTADLAS